MTTTVGLLVGAALAYLFGLLEGLGRGYAQGRAEALVEAEKVVRRAEAKLQEVLRP